MKINWCLGIMFFGMACCFSHMAYAQNSTPYYIEDDKVIFVFDVRDYAEAQRGGKLEKLDFSDLKIYSVALSGDFNAWSDKGWKMKKKGDYIYELKKSIKSFDDPFQLDYKYVINEEYWAQPNITYQKSRVFDNNFFTETYNVDLYDVDNPNGNTFFFLKGHAEASEVILTGDFVGWDERKIKMQKTDEGWVSRIELSPGRYEYKYIVDGDWTHDVDNPYYIMNEHQTYNSVLQKTKPISFKLKGHDDATQVNIAGSFNFWNQTPMIRMETGWQIDLPISGGKHTYNFIVDGKWIIDPTNPIREKNKLDISSSVLLTR